MFGFHLIAWQARCEHLQDALTMYGGDQTGILTAFNTNVNRKGFRYIQLCEIINNIGGA